jgi:hypothetical protein
VRGVLLRRAMSLVATLVATLAVVVQAPAIGTADADLTPNPSGATAAELDIPPLAAPPLAPLLPSLAPAPAPSAVPDPLGLPEAQEKRFGQGTLTIVGATEKHAVLRAELRFSGQLGGPDRVAYQWFRDGVPITGATQAVYWIRAADVGTHLGVRATAYRSGFDLSEYSSLTTQAVVEASERIDTRCLTGSVLCGDVEGNTLRWVENGQVRLVLDARYARPGMVNRYGTFTVNTKTRDGYSWKYGQEMPFAMCYSGSYCIHYSAEFAHVGYDDPYGSHGCINIRDIEHLEWLYKRIPLGTQVVVY